MPVDVVYCQPGECHSPQTYAATLRSRLELAFQCVRQRMQHKLERQKEFYDRKVHGESFQKEIWYGLIHLQYTGTLGKNYIYPGLHLTCIKFCVDYRLLPTAFSIPGSQGKESQFILIDSSYAHLTFRFRTMHFSPGHNHCLHLRLLSTRSL